MGVGAHGQRVRGECGARVSEVDAGTRLSLHPVLPPLSFTQSNDKKSSGSWGWGWIYSWSGRVRRLLSSWMLYQVQQRLMLGALPAKVAGYFLLGAPAVAAGALLYR